MITKYLITLLVNFHNNYSQLKICNNFTTVTLGDDKLLTH